MLILCCHIKIDDFELNTVVNIEVESSWENLTDTCKITFPNNIYWRSQKVDFGNSEILRRGMKVSVSTGYDGVVAEIFQGFITQVHATIPCRIDCEDAMWLLKQKTLSKSYKSANTDMVLKDIIGTTIPYNTHTNTTTLGKFRIVNETPAKVLAYLRENYFFKSWFREGVLHCGFPYIAELQRVHRFEFGTHIIENSLEYKRKNDVKIKIKGITFDRKNKKQEIEVGDPDGEQRTLEIKGISQSDMKKMCEQQIEHLKYDGYRGSFTVFGIPRVNHGDIVEIYDPHYPNRFQDKGRYFIKKVTTKFGVEGYRQEIELEAQVKINSKSQKL